MINVWYATRHTKAWRLVKYITKTSQHHWQWAWREAHENWNMKGKCIPPSPATRTCKARALAWVATRIRDSLITNRWLWIWPNWERGESIALESEIMINRAPFLHLDQESNILKGEMRHPKWRERLPRKSALKKKKKMIYDMISFLKRT